VLLVVEGSRMERRRMKHPWACWRSGRREFATPPMNQSHRKIGRAALLAWLVWPVAAALLAAAPTLDDCNVGWDSPQSRGADVVNQLAP